MNVIILNTTIRSQISIFIINVRLIPTTDITETTAAKTEDGATEKNRQLRQSISRPIGNNY